MDPLMLKFDHFAIQPSRCFQLHTPASPPRYVRRLITGAFPNASTATSTGCVAQSMLANLDRLQTPRGLTRSTFHRSRCEELGLPRNRRPGTLRGPLPGNCRPPATGHCLGVESPFAAIQFVLRCVPYVASCRSPALARCNSADRLRRAAPRTGLPASR